MKIQSEFKLLKGYTSRRFVIEFTPLDNVTLKDFLTDYIRKIESEMSSLVGLPNPYFGQNNPWLINNNINRE